MSTNIPLVSLSSVMLIVPHSFIKIFKAHRASGKRIPATIFSKVSPSSMQFPPAPSLMFPLQNTHE